MEAPDEQATARLLQQRVQRLLVQELQLTDEDGAALARLDAPRVNIGLDRLLVVAGQCYANDPNDLDRVRSLLAVACRCGKLTSSSATLAADILVGLGQLPGEKLPSLPHELRRFLADELELRVGRVSGGGGGGSGEYRDELRFFALRGPKT